MVEQREAEDASRLEALRTAVKVGMAHFEQGRYATFESGAQLRGHLTSVASNAIEGASFRRCSSRVQSRLRVLACTYLHGIEPRSAATTSPSGLETSLGPLFWGLQTKPQSSATALRPWCFLEDPGGPRAERSRSRPHPVSRRLP